MKKKFSSLLSCGLIIICSLTCAETVRSETFVVGFMEDGYPPMFFSKKSHDTGIYKDIYAAISKITGDRFTFAYYPHTRVLYMFEKNRIDIETGVNPAWRKGCNTPGVYTIPFAKLTDVILFRPGKKINVAKPEDLRGRKLGAVRGYVTPGFMSLFARNEIIRIDGNSEQQLMRLMANGRLDQMLINKTVALYWMKKNPDYKNFEIGSAVVEVDIMIRLHPAKKHTVDRLNKALKQLVASGEIERIYAMYVQKILPSPQD